MSHGDEVVKMTDGLEAVVTSEQGAVASTVLWVPVSFSDFMVNEELQITRDCYSFTCKNSKPQWSRHIHHYCLSFGTRGSNCNLLLIVSITRDDGCNGLGINGSFHVEYLIIPYEETSAPFYFTSRASFADQHIGWNVAEQEVEVHNELPQEALMVKEFSRLVKGIKDSTIRLYKVG